MMNLLNTTSMRRVALSVMAAVLSGPSLMAQEAPQTIVLEKGWNAVWLEVEPRYAAGETIESETGPVPLAAEDPLVGRAKAPQDIFTNLAVLEIATPRGLTGTAETFSGEPGQIGNFNQAEWLQWKRVDVAGQNNLLNVPGNRPYLIKSSGAATVALTGHATFFRHTWTADRYNLVGFGLAGSPTFDEFFGPSGTTHAVSKIFTLDATTGNWSRVVTGQSMVSGKAYWVFSSGTSRYQGPVSVDFDLAQRGVLGFGGPRDAVSISQGVSEEVRDTEEIIFTNLGTDTVMPSLDLIAVSGSGLSLRAVTVATDRIGYDFGNTIDSSVGGGGSAALNEDIGSRSSAALTLAAKRNWVTGLVGRTNLYRLNTGPKSASFWLPISALKTDLFVAQGNLPVDGGNQGLWVGEVVVDGVSSIVEDGAPIRPTAGTAPLRVILHSSGTGAVLLSNVTIMQTRTADESVAPVPVLVIDPERIPFFEGIKERNGKRVGIRVEAVAYDLPRKLDAASQDALLNDVAYPGLTEAGIGDFLLGRSGRPPSLSESYNLSWPMGGSVGPGQTLTADFTLDPFHRSNPFRHAFHREQTRGRNIRRKMTIVLDAGQDFSDRLEGSFTETISGMIQADLKVTGRVRFERISPVSTLEGAQ
ncbi:MAG: hypothetical protein ACJAQT_004129 [Akkermansiaceae bacterium]|jgi:hypothetical protein